jgi:hypothetical protein
MFSQPFLIALIFISLVFSAQAAAVSCAVRLGTLPKTPNVIDPRTFEIIVS